MHAKKNVSRCIIALCLLSTLSGIVSATITINSITERSTISDARPILNVSFTDAVNATYNIDGKNNETLCTRSTTGEREVLYYRSNLIHDQGTLFEGFEDVAEWTSNSDRYLHNDTDHYLSGSQGIRMHISGSNFYMQKAINHNFSGAENIILSLYIDDVSGMTKSDIMTFYLTSDNFKTYFKYYIIHAVDGWNTYLMNPSYFVNTNNASWDSNMTLMKLAFYPNAADDYNITFDDMRMGFSARPTCMYVFDDIYYSTYENGTPILEGNGQNGVIAAPVGRTGSSSDGRPLMNLTILTTLKKMGWDIDGHTLNHACLTKCSSARLDRQINGCYQWLVDNGFNDTARYFHYPYGQINDTGIEVVRENHTFGFIASKYYYNPVVTRRGSGEYQTKRCAVYRDQNLAFVKNIIDRSIASDSSIVFCMHSVCDDPDYYGIRTSKLQQISDYLFERKGEIDVVTTSDIADTYTLPDGPHTITVYADNGETKQINFTVDTHELIDGVLYYWGAHITDMRSLYAAVNNSSILDYNSNTNEYMTHYTLQQNTPPCIDASSNIFVDHHTLNESPATIPTETDQISRHGITDLIRKILDYIRSAI